MHMSFLVVHLLDSPKKYAKERKKGIRAYWNDTTGITLMGLIPLIRGRNHLREKDD